MGDAEEVYEMVCDVVGVGVGVSDTVCVAVTVFVNVIVSENDSVCEPVWSILLGMYLGVYYPSKYVPQRILVQSVSNMFQVGFRSGRCWKTDK